MAKLLKSKIERSWKSPIHTCMNLLSFWRNTRSKTIHPDVEELANRLQMLSNFLVEVGEERWAKWFAQDSQRVLLKDFYGVEHTLSAFGGMGSVNDLIIHPINRHRVDETEVKAVNEKLQKLLSRVYTLADQLRREEVKARRSKS